MSLPVVLSLIAFLLALISNMNQILQLAERLYGYYKKVKELKNLKELEKLEKAKTVSLPPKKHLTLPPNYATSSYRRATLMPARKEFDIDIAVYRSAGNDFKKNLSIASLDTY